MSAPTLPDLPPVVYVPTASGGPPAERRVELVTGELGERRLFCFSAPDRLKAFHGAEHWVTVGRQDVAALAADSRAVEVVLDQVPSSRSSEPVPDPEPPREPGSWPPLVYVPTEGGGPAEERRVEMRRTRDGRTALFCYSTIDRLERWVRPGQPWLLVDGAALQRLHDHVPYDLAFIDLPCPPAEEDAR